MAQVIEKYIYLSGAKSNDPLHIDYIPNVFKFTKISVKRTQESLKRHKRAQKRQRRPNVASSKIFTAPYFTIIQEWYRYTIFNFSIICRNYFSYLISLFFHF